VTVLLYDGMSAFELGIVTEVFGLPRPEFDLEWYDLTICSEQSDAVALVGRATMQTPYRLDVFASGQTVIVPGVSDVYADPSPEVMAALRRRRRGARVVSIFSGAFALAAAGLLDGRRAATHWRYADILADRFPKVTVDADVLYVDDGDVLTSAGSAAGLDLCLHLVRKDFGASVANAVARRLVTAPHRPGGQAQFIEAPVADTVDDDRIVRTMEWAMSNLDTSITVEDLARRAHMSSRSYLRHFKLGNGSSPIRWLIAQRIQASLPLLETTNASIDQIAAATGFETATTYRHHFGRAMRTSPTAYRRAFRDGTQSEVDTRPSLADPVGDAVDPGCRLLLGMRTRGPVRLDRHQRGASIRSFAEVWGTGIVDTGARVRRRGIADDHDGRPGDPLDLYLPSLQVRDRHRIDGAGCSPAGHSEDRASLGRGRAQG
jgi:AraC family transcriptional activator FtrA